MGVLLAPGRRRALRRAFGVTAALIVLLATACTGSSSLKLPVGVVADAHFRPGHNGLPFQNYGAQLPDGSAPTNLTADDIRAMFGDAVCADAAIGRCDLIPPARAWQEATNRLMSGGHCYGFAVAAELLWLRKLNVHSLGAPAPRRLRIDNNHALQRLLAYDWTLQLLDSVRSDRVTGSPNTVLRKLTEVLRPHPSETYTLVFFKPDLSAGHAVTPYAVEHEGRGKTKVLIYDNNWPGKTRAVLFDTKANTWSYDAALNPSEPSEIYRGDAKTKSIMLYPTSPGLGRQPCPFCDKVPEPASASGAIGSAGQQDVFLLGGRSRHANVLITDDAGRRIGYVHGKLVDEIPHSAFDPVISTADWRNNIEPELVVPAGRRYTVTLDGTGLRRTDTETLSVIGPSSDVAVRNIPVRPGEKDTLVVGPNATRLSYSSSRDETPTIEVGVSDHRADYLFEISGVADSPGSTVTISLPAEGGTLTLADPGAVHGSRVRVRMTRETERGKHVFEHAGIPLRVGDIAELRFGHWTSAAEGIPLATTHHGHRSVETLDDQRVGAGG